MMSNRKNYLKADSETWLLETNPWTKFKTLTDLLELPLDSPEVISAKQDLLNSPLIQSLIVDAKAWFPQSITRHNVPHLSHYKLMMLADFGLTIDDTGIQEIVEIVLKHYNTGRFQIRQTLPQKGDGFAKPDPNDNEWHAQPCDSPLITYALLRLGVTDSKVQASIDYLKEAWQDEKGWFCHFFFVEGIFRKLQIGCPMASLMALQVFSQVPELKESDAAKNAFAPLQYHRDSGKSLYFFGRGKKFRTFKYPFVWYNALYLADVLTRFEFLRGNELVRELVDWIEAAPDENGRFKPTSIFMPYRSWDFGNKKEPSPWITFLCHRILKQWYGE
jgi:hypothetical protein